jgi:hypothetical protein
VSAYRDQVTAAVGAVRIRGPVAYVWLGRRSRRVPRAVLAKLDPIECRRHLVALLREELYVSFYCTGAPVPSRWGAAAPGRAALELRAKLSSANTGHGSWEPGWIVERGEGDEAIVVAPRLRVRVPMASCRVDRGGGVVSGAGVSVRVPKELPALSPGFFMMVSDAPFDAAFGAGVVRVYWHITSNGAPPLARSLTTRLNAEGIPFRLKLADHHDLFDRCDAAVLYLHGEDFPSVKSLLGATADSLRAHLHPRVPALTLELAPGVGLAESPGPGRSFGISRCAVVAEGIVNAHERGIRGVSARAAFVMEHLRANGIEIDAPYREPSLSGHHVL